MQNCNSNTDNLDITKYAYFQIFFIELFQFAPLFHSYLYPLFLQTLMINDWSKLFR